ncbi:type II secretion system F family protein [Embleya sp. MST-111070]|uniref:type II secretion system F family protein n=1 Tax=Embleya sp. MST-111070 TaxID=3398231 RepID=UPI003F73991B
MPGAGVGFGLAMLAREVWPAPPDLHTALKRLQARERATSIPTERPGRTSVDERIVGAVREIRAVRIPERDLALTGQTPTEYLRTKITMAFLGFFMPLIATAGAAVLGISLPFSLPLLASVLLAVALWLAPNHELRQRAANARVEFRHAAAAYLDLVALERAGDAGPSEALERAAEVGNGWAFDRIQDTLERARNRGVAPWAGLKDLSEDLGLPELADVADIIELAGTEGAAVYGTLRARAGSLRSELLETQKDKANTDSERLVVPGTILVLLMVLFLAAPAMFRIVTTN